MPIDDSTPPPSPPPLPERSPKDSDFPATWPELLQASQEQVSLGLEMIHEVPVELETVTPPWLPSGSFMGPAQTLAMATVVAGPAVCAEAMHLLVPLVPKVMGDFTLGIDATNRVQAMHLLAFFSTVQCSGAQLSPIRGALPSAAFTAERTWPWAMARELDALSDRERERLAFAALGVGAIELMETILGAPLPEAFTAESAVDVQPRAFLPYLTTAVLDFAPIEAVEPVWSNVVESFPEQLAAGTMDWTELMYSARVVLTRFCGHPLGTVTNTMHRMLTA